jgi:hypothetical protein
VVKAIVVGAVVVLVIAVVVVSHRRGRANEGRADSDLRDAFVGILMTVGPFFGVRYQPPHVEIPVVTTPASDELDPATAARLTGDDEVAPGA